MKSWKKISGTVCITLAVMIGTASGDPEDWSKLKKKADKVYGGIDIEVDVRTGLQTNTGITSLNELESETGPYGSWKMRVPLYSKTRRIENQNGKVEFLSKGTDYIKTIEQNSRIVETLKQKAKILKTVMQDEGVPSIEAYYNVLNEIAVKEAEIEQARRNLEAMLR